MTVDLKSFRVALQLAGLQVSEEAVWLLGHLYEEVKAKGDKTTIEDINRVKALLVESLKHQ